MDGRKPNTREFYSMPVESISYRTVPAGTVGNFHTGTLTGTKTRLFRTAFCTGAYRVVLEKTGEKNRIPAEKRILDGKRKTRKMEVKLNGKRKYHATHNTAIASTVPKVTSHSSSSSSSRPSLHPSASLSF